MRLICAGSVVRAEDGEVTSPQAFQMARIAAAYTGEEAAGDRTVRVPWGRGRPHLEHPWRRWVVSNLHGELRGAVALVPVPPAGGVSGNPRHPGAGLLAEDLRARAAEDGRDVTVVDALRWRPDAADPGGGGPVEVGALRERLVGRPIGDDLRGRAVVLVDVLVRSGDRLRAAARVLGDMGVTPRLALAVACVVDAPAGHDAGVDPLSAVERELAP